tara:strand:+ start:2773 stop:3468 length:696 start_codon:yes stop_codon:yes gene_type:complete
MNWAEMQLLDNTTQEEWFDMWCEPLIELGYIDEVVTHPNVPTFELFPGLSKPYGKVKNVILSSTAYTPDRIIKWNNKSMGIFFTPFVRYEDWDKCYFKPQYTTPSVLPSEFESGKGFYYSLIEVKGPTGNQKAYGSDFKFTQKWLWANTQQYVQKVMLAPAKLFKQEKSWLPYLWSMTFTPERFLYSDKLATNKNKSIPYRTIPNKKGVPLWEVRTLEEFLKTKKTLSREE